MKEAYSGLILAGGLGTRLRSVYDGPKVIAPVLGRPFISYLMDQLVAAKVTQLILCVGYKAEKVREVIGETYKDVPVSYSVEETLMGTGGAIACGARLATEERVVTMNGDSYSDLSISEFTTWCEAEKCQIAMTMTYVDDVSRFGRVTFSEKNRILSFEEKGESAGGGYINTGIYMLTRDQWEGISMDQPVSIEKEIFPRLVSKKKLYGYPVKGKFLDIGTPESYARAEVFFGGSE